MESEFETLSNLHLRNMNLCKHSNTGRTAIHKNIVKMIIKYDYIAVKWEILSDDDATIGF